MKAPMRSPGIRRGVRRRSDAGVSEVVGFILMFGLSAIILIISVQSFTTAENTSNAMLAGAEMKGVADRIATRLVQVGIIYQQFPNASANITLTVPPTIAGKSYAATITPTTVYVNTTDASAEATSSTFHLDAYSAADPCFLVKGTVPSSWGAFIVSYSPSSPLTGRPPGCVAPTTVKTIQLLGGVP
ncbi:MAG: hypothetical protein ACYDDF_01945 [Thermoplasmatota archaeon]